MSVSEILERWYEANKRTLPWRETNDAYKIWISEIILQQTRVIYGIPYYQRFLEKFPDIIELAKAPADEVLRVWQGLGYYSRARYLHKAARIIVFDFQALFPTDIHILKKLPGIGDYTAAAICSFAFGQAYPVVDGNVYRVLARLFEIPLTNQGATGKKLYNEIATRLLDKKNPALHNQAMMELGATVCLPLNPRCGSCPLSSSCFANVNHTVDRYPGQKKKNVQKSRYFYYVHIKKNSHYFIQQRKEKDIWAMLYEFPLIERKENTELSELYNTPEWKHLSGNHEFRVSKISKEYKHQLSHQIIHTLFLEVIVRGDYKLDEYIEVGDEKIKKYPVSRLIERYLEDTGSYL